MELRGIPPLSKTNLQYTKFEIFLAVINGVVVWDVSPCSLRGER